jgi:glycosyltransferase involved in cell wall biosynthesis
MRTFMLRSTVKVLHVQKASGIGGSERHLLTLLPALRDAGHEVRMCVPLAGDGAVFVRALRARGIETATVRAGPDLNPLLIGWLRGEIRRYDPDVVHTHLVHADLHGQAGAALTRTPRVSTVHGPGAFARQGPYRAVTRLVGMLTPLTIAISHHIRERLERSGQRRRGTVRVIHYGIDAAEWSSTEAERGVLRERFGLAADDVAVAICARLIPGKGHELLLDATERALDRAPGLRVLVAGQGPLRPRIERRAEQLPAGTVRLLGFVEEMRALMTACDVLVFPTSPELDEGFGLAALEAMAAGRPVVATSVGALPEIVEPGRTGILVAPEDPAALAAALVELATKPAVGARLGRRGRDRALAEFGIERMVSRTIAVYAEARTGA